MPRMPFAFVICCFLATAPAAGAENKGLASLVETAVSSGTSPLQWGDMVALSFPFRAQSPDGVNISVSQETFRDPFADTDSKPVLASLALGYRSDLTGLRFVLLGADKDRMPYGTDRSGETHNSSGDWAKAWKALRPRGGRGNAATAATVTGYTQDLPFAVGVSMEKPNDVRVTLFAGAEMASDLAPASPFSVGSATSGLKLAPRAGVSVTLAF